MTNRPQGTLYIGVTNDIIRRVYEHKNKVVPGFTKKYSLYYLVYYEVFSDVNEALESEKRLKNWHRQWKIDLIEENNPEWRDLYNEIIS